MNEIIMELTEICKLQASIIEELYLIAEMHADIPEEVERDIKASKAMLTEY